MTGKREWSAFGGRALVVDPDVVRAVKGGNAALVATLIDQRCRPNGHDTVVDGDGVWWRVSQREIAERSGLTENIVRRAVVRAVAAGVITTTTHHMLDGFDRTLSYRPTGSV